MLELNHTIIHKFFIYIIEINKSNYLFIQAIYSEFAIASWSGATICVWQRLKDSRSRGKALSWKRRRALGMPSSLLASENCKRAN